MFFTSTDWKNEGGGWFHGFSNQHSTSWWLLCRCNIKFYNYNDCGYVQFGTCNFLASDKLQRYFRCDGAENMEVDVSKSAPVSSARRCNGRKIPFWNSIKIWHRGSHKLSYIQHAKYDIIFWICFVVMLVVSFSIKTWIKQFRAT